MKIVDISIKRPSMVIVLFTILLLGGLYSYKQLSYELIPKFEVNVVTVSTVYPGASPNEVENTVTKKIEDAVSTMENIKKLENVSKEDKAKLSEGIQENIKKFHHPDLENAIKINKEYKDKKAQEKENK